MQPTTVMQVQSAPAMVAPPQQRSYMNVSAIRGLGIAQLVIGILTLILGIASMAALSHNYWLTKSGGGVWGGLWIIVTGILGIASSYYTSNGMLNGSHMAFCIIASCVAFIDGIMFCAGLGYYNRCSFTNYYSWAYNWNDYYDCVNDRGKARGIYGCLVFLMIGEFFISIIAAVYCCKATAGCCGGPSSTGVIIQQQPNYIVTSTTGTTVIPASTTYPNSGFVTTQQYSYPQQGHPQQGYPQQGYPQHGYPQQGYPQQSVVMPQYPGGQTYSNQALPQQIDVTKAMPPAYTQ